MPLKNSNEFKVRLTERAYVTPKFLTEVDVVKFDFEFKLLDSAVNSKILKYLASNDGSQMIARAKQNFAAIEKWIIDNQVPDFNDTQKNCKVPVWQPLQSLADRYKSDPVLGPKSGAAYFQLFTTQLKNIEIISILLMDERVPLEFRKDSLAELSRGIVHSCLDGQLTRINNTAYALQAYIDPGFCFMYLRCALAKELALKTMAMFFKKPDEIGNIHAINYLMHPYSAILGIPETSENETTDHRLHKKIHNRYETTLAEEFTLEQLLENFFLELSYSDFIHKITLIQDSENFISMPDELRRFIQLNEFEPTYFTTTGSKTLHTKGFYLLYTNIVIRMIALGYIANKHFKIQHNEIFINYFPNKSLNFSYIKDVRGNIKPFMLYVIELLEEHKISDIKEIFTFFNEAVEAEIISALAGYVREEKVRAENNDIASIFGVDNYNYDFNPPDELNDIYDLSDDEKNIILAKRKEWEQEKKQLQAEKDEEQKTADEDYDKLFLNIFQLVPETVLPKSHVSSQEILKFIQKFFASKSIANLASDLKNPSHIICFALDNGMYELARYLLENKALNYSSEMISSALRHQQRDIALFILKKIHSMNLRVLNINVCRSQLEMAIDSHFSEVVMEIIEHGPSLRGFKPTLQLLNLIAHQDSLESDQSELLQGYDVRKLATELLKHKCSPYISVDAPLFVNALLNKNYELLELMLAYIDEVDSQSILNQLATFAIYQNDEKIIGVLAKALAPRNIVLLIDYVQRADKLDANYALLKPLLQTICEKYSEAYAHADYMEVRSLHCIFNTIMKRDDNDLKKILQNSFAPSDANRKKWRHFVEAVLTAELNQKQYEDHIKPLIKILLDREIIAAHCAIAKVSIMQWLDSWVVSNPDLLFIRNDLQAMLIEKALSTNNSYILRYAVDSDRIDLVQNILEKCSLELANGADGNGDTTLHSAAGQDSSATVAAITALATHPKVNVNLQNSAQQTPLHVARLNDKKTFIKVFSQNPTARAKVSIDIPDSRGKTIRQHLLKSPDRSWGNLSNPAVTLNDQLGSAVLGLVTMVGVISSFALTFLFLPAAPVAWAVTFLAAGWYVYRTLENKHLTELVNNQTLNELQINRENAEFVSSYEKIATLIPVNNANKTVENNFDDVVIQVTPNPLSGISSQNAQPAAQYEPVRLNL